MSAAPRRPTAVLGQAAILLVLLAGAGRAGPARAQDEAVGVTEHAGAFIPADIQVMDEHGRLKAFGDLADRPAILGLVYYRCERMCPQLLVGLGRLVSDLELRPGADYRIVTVSFDRRDGPAEAAAARLNYLRPLGTALASGAWTFATASKENIDRLTAAVGFRFKAEGHGFIHPVILVILGPGGRMSRYVHPAKYNYGVAYPFVFSAVEMKQALLEAARGRVSPSSPGPLLFCFPHEPSEQAGFFRLTAVFGWITLAGMAILFVSLTIIRKRPKEGR